MGVGLGLLRLSPARFWAMSLPEMQAAIDGLFGRVKGGTPLRRAELVDLMHKFPDHAEGVGDE